MVVMQLTHVEHIQAEGGKLILPRFWRTGGRGGCTPVELEWCFGVAESELCFKVEVDGIRGIIWEDIIIVQLSVLWRMTRIFSTIFRESFHWLFFFSYPWAELLLVNVLTSIKTDIYFDFTTASFVIYSLYVFTLLIKVSNMTKTSRNISGTTI